MCIDLLTRRGFAADHSTETSERHDQDLDPLYEDNQLAPKEHRIRGTYLKRKTHFGSIIKIAFDFIRPTACNMYSAHRALLCLLVSVLVSGVITLPSVLAQSPVADCASRTATNATLVFPEDLRFDVNGTAYEGDALVAVLDSSGMCAGKVMWNGDATTLTVWGNDQSSPHSSQLLSPGDSLYLYVSLASTPNAYTPSNSRIDMSFRSRPYTTDVARYTPNGVYIVDRITIQTPPVSERETTTSHVAP